MEIREREQDGSSVLALNGEFDSDHLPALRDRVDRLLGAGTRRLCLNLRDLRFINSTALSYLVETNKDLRSRGGELVFSEPSAFLRSAIRTLELHHIFEVFETDAEALAYLAERSA